MATARRDPRLIIEAACVSTPQARVVTEKIKQLGCWPDDFDVLPIESGAHRGHVLLTTGRRKGRVRGLRVDMDGRTTT